MRLNEVDQIPEESGNASDNDDVTVGADVEELLPENPNRKSALIIVVGEGTIRVTTDGTDPTPTHGKPVTMLSLTSPFCPTGPVLAVSQDGTSVVVNASEVN